MGVCVEGAVAIVPQLKVFAARANFLAVTDQGDQSVAPTSSLPSLHSLRLIFRIRFFYLVTLVLL
jgi:hypothetical protein